MSKPDAYKQHKAAELSKEMQACYEDAKRTQDFDPTTNLRAIRMKAMMDKEKISSIQAMTQLLPALAGWDDRAEAQKAYREILASAYYYFVVEPALKNLPSA